MPLKTCPIFQIYLYTEKKKKEKGDPKHPHTVSFNEHLSTKNVKLKCRSKTLAETANKQNTDVVSSFGNTSEQTFSKMKINFEATSFATKNELPISTCKNILRLEEKHGAAVGRKYLNYSSIGVFIDYIGDGLKQQLSSDITKAKFYGGWCDGYTDANTIANEANCKHVMW